ncbi:hypothetical protein ABVT39_017800 [Epinephelus coioides]
MLHFLLNDRTDEVTYPKDAIFIQDGKALFHSLTNLPPTFGAICLHVLDQMVAKKQFIFSTDSYQPDSVKAQERLRRDFSEKFIVKGTATRKPQDFKLFLDNEENNQQLCQLMLKVWGSEEATSGLAKCETAVLIVEGTAYQLTSLDGEVEVIEIHALQSDQEETDSRVVLYLHYAVKLGFKSAVVTTPDSDIFFILLHHADTISLVIYLDTQAGTISWSTSQSWPPLLGSRTAAPCSAIMYSVAAEPIFWRPKPYDEGQGLEKKEGGILEPVWSCGPILPPSLIDLLAAGVISDDDEREVDEVDTDDETDYDDYQ